MGTGHNMCTISCQEHLLKIKTAKISSIKTLFAQQPCQKSLFTIVHLKYFQKSYIKMIRKEMARFQMTIVNHLSTFIYKYNNQNHDQDLCKNA